MNTCTRMMSRVSAEMQLEGQGRGVSPASLLSLLSLTSCKELSLPDVRRLLQQIRLQLMCSCRHNGPTVPPQGETWSCCGLVSGENPSPPVFSWSQSSIIEAGKTQPMAPCRCLPMSSSFPRLSRSLAPGPKELTKPFPHRRLEPSWTQRPPTPTSTLAPPPGFSGFICFEGPIVSRL